MNSSELAKYFQDGLAASLKRQFLIVDKVSNLGKMPQPGVFVEIEPATSEKLEGTLLGSYKGMLVSAKQQTSSDPDPFLRYLFYVPLDPAGIDTEKVGSNMNKIFGVRITVITDLGEKYVTGGQDQFRNVHALTKDVVGVLSGEMSGSFGTKSFRDLYKEADDKFSTVYGGTPADSKTVTTTGMMLLLLELTEQKHLAETGVTGSGTFLKGDYGVFTTDLFSAIEDVKDGLDRNTATSSDGKKHAFTEMVADLGLKSFSSGSGFSDSFEDFKKYNLSEFILAGRDDSSSLFFNPEIENSIYQITEAGAPDPREGFVENIVEQDQLGAADKLVASSLLGAKVAEDKLKIDQIKKITNVLVSTQAAKSAMSGTSSGLARAVNTELLKYLSVFKRLVSRSGSIIA